MKKYLCYLADLLTLMRVVLATILIWGAFQRYSVGVGFGIFLLAELTDAFDGYCSRHWPYKKAPWFRKYAVKYDMFADVLLWFAMVLFFTLVVDFWAGLILFEATLLGCGIIELVVYGKFFGHPDDCLEFSLCKRNFKIAKKIILVRRWYYLATIILVASWMLFATGWALWVKILILVVGVAICAFLWFFLETRRKNISRDAIKIEKKLSKKAGARKIKTQKPRK